MTSIVFRLATPTDFSDIAALHRENLLSNLSDDQRQDGFLSIDWTEQDITAANRDLAIIVAVNDDSVIGYVAGTTVDYNRRFPLINYMIDRFDETHFQGRSLSHYRSFLYGPICIAKPYRGTGVLQGLFQALLAHLTGRYDIGVAFVAKTNPRSLHAHTQKLGMTVLRDFEFKGNSYVMLAFGI